MLDDGKPPKRGMAVVRAPQKRCFLISRPKPFPRVIVHDGENRSDDTRDSLRHAQARDAMKRDPTRGVPPSI
jgi:hypothetical protein